MYTKNIKNLAIDLRQQGKTYSDIKNSLGININNSTLSGWLKNISLTKAAKKTLEINIAKKLRLAQIAGSKSIFVKRKTFLESILAGNLKFTKSLSLHSQKLLLSILYLGEGAKYKSTNSLRLAS